MCWHAAVTTNDIYRLMAGHRKLCGCRNAHCAGRKAGAGNVKLKRGRLDTLPPRTVRISINLLMPLACAIYHPINLPVNPVSPGMAGKSGTTRQRDASGDGFSANAEGQALNNAAAHRMRGCAWYRDKWSAALLMRWEYSYKPVSC